MCVYVRFLGLNPARKRPGNAVRWKVIKKWRMFTYIFLSLTAVFLRAFARNIRNNINVGKKKMEYTSKRVKGDCWVYGLNVLKKGGNL